MDRYNQVALRSYDGDPLVAEWGGEACGGRTGVAEIVCGLDGRALPVVREGGGVDRAHAYFHVQPGHTVLIHAERQADTERATASVVDAVGPDGRIAQRLVALLDGVGPYDGPACLLDAMRVALDKTHCYRCDARHYPDAHWEACAA